MPQLGTGLSAATLLARMNAGLSSEISEQELAAPRGFGLTPRSASSGSRPRQNRAASADGDLSAQYALEAKDAELGLLRARFNLRLDAERLKTEGASSSLREACKEATQLQQKAAVAELAAMRQRFDETTSLQRSAMDAALSEQRMRTAEEQSSLRAEACASNRRASELELELHAARQAAEEQSRKLAEVRQAAEAEIAEERSRRQEDAVELRVQFAQQREVLVEEVVARFEQEHFRLSTTAAAEVERRKKAEGDAAEIRERLKGVQESLNATWLKPKPESTRGMSMSIAIQTDFDDSPPCCSPRLREELSMRLADLEGRHRTSAAAEAERLELVDAGFRKAVALKNDTIDALKDELWRREREILEARGIMAGLGEVTKV